MQHLWCVTALLLFGSLTLRFGGTRKKMLVNWISHSSGRYRDPTFGHQKWTFFGFASKKWNHLARTTLTDVVTSRDITEPIKPVRWRFGLRALALRGGSSYQHTFSRSLSVFATSVSVVIQLYANSFFYWVAGALSWVTLSEFSVNTFCLLHLLVYCKINVSITTHDFTL